MLSNMDDPREKLQTEINCLCPSGTQKDLSITASYIVMACFLKTILYEDNTGQPQDLLVCSTLVFIHLFTSSNYIYSVRFEVFTAVTMNNGVFWDATPCGSCQNRRFGGT
jgi:hypothetical protein